MVTLGHKWSQTVTLGNKWSQTVTLGHKWSQMVTLGHKWSQAVTLGHKWSQAVTLGHKWSMKIWAMKILADELLARPRGHDDVCRVTQCAHPICKYYKQCNFNCVELGFFDNLNKIQTNLPYVDAIRWLNRCNDNTIRRFIAYISRRNVKSML
jgi:hypothetical protein